MCFEKVFARAYVWVLYLSLEERAGDVKFNIQLSVDNTVFIFFIVDRLKGAREKEGLYRRMQAGSLTSSKDFLPLVHLCYKTTYY